MRQLELQMEGGPAIHKDVGGTFFHGRRPSIESPVGRAIFGCIPPGWAGLGTGHGLFFEETQRSVSLVLRVVGNVPGLHNTRVM